MGCIYQCHITSVQLHGTTHWNNFFKQEIKCNVVRPVLLKCLVLCCVVVVVEMRLMKDVFFLLRARLSRSLGEKILHFFCLLLYRFRQWERLPFSEVICFINFLANSYPFPDQSSAPNIFDSSNHNELSDIRLNGRIRTHKHAQYTHTHTQRAAEQTFGKQPLLKADVKSKQWDYYLSPAW